MDSAQTKNGAMSEQQKEDNQDEIDKLTIAKDMLETKMKD